MVHLASKVRLLTQIEEKAKERNTKVDFLVEDAPRVYKITLGKPTIRKITLGKPTILKVLGP